MQSTRALPSLFFKTRMGKIDQKKPPRSLPKLREISLLTGWSGSKMEACRVVEQRAEILEVLRALLAEIMEEPLDDFELSEDDRFQFELELESIELVALGDALQERYGAQLNFAGWLSGMGLEALLELRVGDLIDWLTSTLREGSGEEADGGGVSR